MEVCIIKVGLSLIKLCELKLLLCLSKSCLLNSNWIALTLSYVIKLGKSHKKWVFYFYLKMYYIFSHFFLLLSTQSIIMSSYDDEKKWSIIKIPSLPAGGLTLNKASCYYKRHNTLLSLASMSENMEHTKTGSCGRQGTAIKECRKICSTFKSTDDVMAQKFGDLLAQSYKNIRLFLR